MGASAAVGYWVQEKLLWGCQAGSNAWGTARIVPASWRKIKAKYVMNYFYFIHARYCTWLLENCFHCKASRCMPWFHWLNLYIYILCKSMPYVYGQYMDQYMFIWLYLATAFFPPHHCNQNSWHLCENHVDLKHHRNMPSGVLIEYQIDIPRYHLTETHPQTGMQDLRLECWCQIWQGSHILSWGHRAFTWQAGWGVVYTCMCMGKQGWDKGRI